MEDKVLNEQAAGGQSIDYTKYPEGFNAILELLDFIPEERRMGTMLSLIDNLGRR